MSSSATWLCSEPKLAALAWKQARRLFVRGRHRPLLTLGLALVLAAMLFIAQSWRGGMYRAQVGVVLRDGIFSADGRAPSLGQLRSLATDLVLTPARLDSLVGKHDLLHRLGGASPAEAAARLRKLVEVHVWRDHCDSYPTHPDLPHSARVTLAFSGPDPSLALAVAHDLGTFVVEAQIARESELAAADLAALRVRAEKAAAAAAQQNEQLEREREDVLRRPDSQFDLRLQQIEQTAKSAEDASREAAADLLDAELKAAHARPSQDRPFVMDTGAPVWSARSSGERLARQGALSFFFAVFLAVILVGAFDPAIRDEEDLMRLGLRPLGRIQIGSSATAGSKVKLRRAVARRAFNV